MERFQGLDSLMSTFGLDKAKNFQAYWNEVMARNENQDLNIEGFVWDAPQIDFTYEMLEATAKVEVMATYVSLDSPALPAGKQAALTKLTGSIPRQKYTIVRGENDYRKELITLNEIKAVAAYANRSETQAVREYLAKTLFTTLVDLPNAHKNSLNYQVGQAKSTGKLVINDKNNPRGIKGITIDFQVPAGNTMAAKWFTRNTTKGTFVANADANPVEDLRDFITELRLKAGGYQNVCVEMSERWFNKLLKHPAVLTAIGYAMTGLGLRYTKANDDNAVAVAKGASPEAQRTYFKQVIDADELILNRTQCGVEKINAATKSFEQELLSAFDDEVILVRPSGTIGVIKNVATMRPDGSAIYADIFGGRGIVEYLYNADTRTQTWRSEMTYLAVPNRPKDMYYFKGVEEVSGE